MTPMATCAGGIHFRGGGGGGAAAVAKKSVLVCKKCAVFVLRWLCTQLGLLGGH